MQYTQYSSGSSKCNTLVSSPPGFVALGNCTLHKAHRNTDAWMLQKPRTLDGQAYKCACFQACKCQSAWNRAYAQKHKYAQKHVYVRQHSTHPQLDGLSSGSRFGWLQNVRFFIEFVDLKSKSKYSDLRITSHCPTPVCAWNSKIYFCKSVMLLYSPGWCLVLLIFLVAWFSLISDNLDNFGYFDM